jgi:hypothetical protein
MRREALMKRETSDRVEGVVMCWMRILHVGAGVEGGGLVVVVGG